LGRGPAVVLSSATATARSGGRWVQWMGAPAIGSRSRGSRAPECPSPVPGCAAPPLLRGPSPTGASCCAAGRVWLRLEGTSICRIDADRTYSPVCKEDRTARNKVPRLDSGALAQRACVENRLIPGPNLGFRCELTSPPRDRQTRPERAPVGGAASSAPDGGWSESRRTGSALRKGREETLSIGRAESDAVSCGPGGFGPAARVDRQPITSPRAGW